MSGPIRYTASARYRSGSEVLLHDSGPIFTVDDARRLAMLVSTLIAAHGDDIMAGDTELIVRVAAREFEATGDRPTPAPKPPRQAAAECEF
jgi:hypothetical protein